MTPIPFVDAHIHLWDLERLRYPWLTPPFNASGLSGSVEAIAKTYRIADYRQDAAHWSLAGAVHVDAGAHRDDALAETQWLESLNAGDGLPSAIVAFAALELPSAEALLERQSSHPHVRGIRQIANWHPNSYYSYTARNLLDDPAWYERGFPLLAKYRLSFDFQAYPGQFERAARLFERHPEVPIALNHCGMPLMREAHGYADWRAGMARLAPLAQVHVKISGFGITDHGWTIESIRRYVLETVELFGAERCMLASDFPTDKLYADFDRVIGAYDTIVASFSDAERRALFGRTADRFYRLGLAL